jgi:hypothetical protein
MYRHDAVGIVEGQSSKDDAIDHREDRRGGADAERQHAEGDEGERRRLAQRPNRGTQVVQHRGCDARTGASVGPRGRDVAEM